MRRTLLSGLSVAVVGGMGGLVGCVGVHESSARRDLARAQREVTSSSQAGDSDRIARAAPEPVAGELAEYWRIAWERSPEILASFERWKASVFRISQARRLPEPTLGLGYFVRSIETRVGPQRARISVQQAFPWPTRLTAGADAAAARAQAMQRQFEALALLVAQRVAFAYWDLWQIRTTRRVHQEHLEVIRDLSQSVRALMATGLATLAEVQQVDLRTARIEDNIRSMDQAERRAAANLRATVGVGPHVAVPTSTEPGSAAMPAESPKELLSAARSHPLVDSSGLLAEAMSATARAKGAERLPRLTLGAELVLTGDAALDGVEGSGRDAVMVGAGVQLPLWQDSYSDGVQAAQAEARAHRADQRAKVHQAEAQVASTLADLSDATRRVALCQGTLVPQAEVVYASVLGAYAVGRGTVTQALLSQRDLLELRIELLRARADYARAWARLEQLVGHKLVSSTDQQDVSAEGGGPSDEAN